MVRVYCSVTLCGVALLLALVALNVAGALPQLPTMTEELRYCGVVRDVHGVIVRSAAVLRDFRRVHACPATGLTTGACPGWALDHVVPLVCGGCDAVSNLQWLPLALKSCAGTLCKDRWEQRVYCSTRVTS